MMNNINRLMSLTKVTEALDTAHASLDLTELSDLNIDELEGISDIVTSINFMYTTVMNKKMLLLEEVKTDVDTNNRIDAVFQREPRSGAV